MAAGAARPGLHRMGERGGDPTDGPKARGAEGQHRMPLMLELCPMEGALASAALADEFAFLVSHNGGGVNSMPGQASRMGGLNPGYNPVTSEFAQRSMVLRCFTVSDSPAETLARRFYFPFRAPGRPCDPQQYSLRVSAPPRELVFLIDTRWK